MLGAELDDDRAQSSPGRKQPQRACHRALADAALAGHDDQLAFQQRGHCRPATYNSADERIAADAVEQLLVYDERGLVPCVVQDWASGEVLTLAYMNELALQRTRATGELHLWSRSRERAVAQGRHERQHAGGSRAACGLRR